ncbi:alpha/beta fold hydrolase [Pseudonocardiaceae bacterium YIM PH 21723]|nr:alpha/beta fold hydrolase [Pseudonocardiaceae bacterium YIM PH 21723]
MPLLAGLGILLIGALLAWLLLPASRPADIRSTDVTIPVAAAPDSPQTIDLDATVFQPERTPAPAVLLAHGFGGNKDDLRDQATELARSGMLVLTFTARGFGKSGGQIALNSPDFEIADGKALVSWLAQRPDVLKDGPDDPKVGVSGGSYGGAFALLLAGTDKRVDVIAPVITYNDLTQSLLPNNATAPGPAGAGTPAAAATGGDGVLKKDWVGRLFAGAARSPQPGSKPEPSVCGRFQPQVCAAYIELATTGRPGAATLDLLHRNSPATVTGNITVPTLLVQGEQDTLFGLDQADANARQIRAAGGTVKVVWYPGGHDGEQPDQKLRGQIGDWLHHYLTKSGAEPSQGFSYTVRSPFRSGGSAGRTVTAPGYPDQTPRDTLPLSGPQQPVLTPPGGNPASTSSIPGLSAFGGSAVGSLLSVDPPGQFALFQTEPLPAQLTVSGVSTVDVQVAGMPGAGGDATLFVKLYDVAPDGRRTLPGGAVAPIRVQNIPADGSPATVRVSLPGVVAPIAAGHRLAVVVASTESSYAGDTQPSIHLVGMASGLTVPKVGGTREAAAVPLPALLGIGAALLALLLAVLAATIRRRRADTVQESLTGVPLAIEGLSKSYPGGLTAVRDLSFRVEQGQVLGLLGPNGAGKTTTLRMLMGLVHPSAGTIRVFGHAIFPGAPVLSRIGSFVEGSGFLPHASGMENLRLYWAATGRPESEARFDEALEIAGLGTSVRRRVGTYSQGMRQRLAIAQAMLGLPDLLVLDEPANGLDPPQIHQMRDVLRRYAASGRTVLVSSHLLSEVEQTCTHVVVMHRGALVAEGEVADIVAGGGAATFTVDDRQRAIAVLEAMDGVSEVAPEHGAIITNGAAPADILVDAVPDVAEGATSPEAAPRNGTSPGPRHAAAPREAAAPQDGTPGDKGVVHANLGGLPRSVAVAALVDAGIAVDSAGPRRRLEDAFLQLVGEGPSL